MRHLQNAVSAGGGVMQWLTFMRYVDVSFFSNWLYLMFRVAQANFEDSDSGYSKRCGRWHPRTQKYGFMPRRIGCTAHTQVVQF